MIVSGLLEFFSTLWFKVSKHHPKREQRAGPEYDTQKTGNPKKCSSECLVKSSKAVLGNILGDEKPLVMLVSGCSGLLTLGSTTPLFSVVISFSYLW